MSSHSQTLRVDGRGRTAQEWIIIAVAVAIVTLAVTDASFLVFAMCLGLAIVALLRFEFFVYGLVLVLPWYPLLDARPPFRDPFLLLRFVLLAGVWVIRRKQGKSSTEWLAGSRLSKGILVFGAVALISLLVSDHRANIGAFRSLVRLFSYLAVFFALSGWLENRRQITAIIRVLLISTICVAIFGFYQAYERGYTDVYFHLYPLQEDALEPWAGRITSFLFHFNSLAGYLNLALPFSIACMTFAENRLLRILAFVSHTMAGAALYLTGSRGGLIAYCGMLVISMWFLKPKRTALPKVLLSMVLAAGLVLALQERGGGGRLEVDDFTQGTRLALWGAAGAMFQGHPVLGVGYGNYRSLYNDYLPGVTPDQLDAHNLYLQLLAETGVIGFLTFSALMVAFARIASKLARRADPFYRLVGVGLGGALAGSLIHGMVDYIFNTSPQFGALFWLVLALGTVAWGQFENSEGERQG